MVPLFFLTPNSTILTPGRGSPLLSVTVPLISIPAADAAVFSIKSRTFIIDAKLVNKECKLLTLFA